MTPKEKAEDLFDKFKGIVIDYEGRYRWIARECCLIAVDEIRSRCEWDQHLYWHEVKQEIEKL